MRLNILLGLGFLFLFMTNEKSLGQWTDNGSTTTTTDRIGINITDPGSYWLNVNGSAFFNDLLTFPTVSHTGLTSKTVMTFPAKSDGAHIISRQPSSDIYEFIFRIWDNTTGDSFKIWFDDYRGSSYDRYPLKVYGNKVLFASDGGNVGIGTNSPTEKLTVNGITKTEEVIVTENVGADFVFEDNYQLPDLADVETFIHSNRHLPEIPTAEQMKKEGVKIGDLQMKLLQKIEELTLYIIELKKENTTLKKENEIKNRDVYDRIKSLEEKLENSSLKAQMDE